jgi:Fe-S cluster biosynthesis and repair protein YggX
MSERLVYCSRLKKEAPGLTSVPFQDALGQEIYEKVSAQVWTQWKDEMMIKVINEYRLNLADADHYASLINQMKAFLGLSDQEVLEVENPNRGK